jgi:hypothetical protein
LLSGHSQLFTWWLNSGEQPHAPIMHVLGKSPVILQHMLFVTFPPEVVHVCSIPASDALVYE